MLPCNHGSRLTAALIVFGDLDGRVTPTEVLIVAMSDGDQRRVQEFLAAHLQG